MYEPCNSLRCPSRAGNSVLMNSSMSARGSSPMHTLVPGSTQLTLQCDSPADCLANCTKNFPSGRLARSAITGTVLMHAPLPSMVITLCPLATSASISSTRIRLNTLVRTSISRCMTSKAHCAIRSRVSWLSRIAMAPY